MNITDTSLKVLADNKAKGLLCTGPHGLLLHSAGMADASKAGYVGSLYSKGESLHQEDPAPIITVETATM